MKKQNRIARKGDTARTRAQSKPATSAEPTKPRLTAEISDTLICGGCRDDLRKDHEGFYVIGQLGDHPRRRVTRLQALRWFLDEGFVPDEFLEDFRSVTAEKPRFNLEVVIALGEEMLATKALFGLCFAQLTMNFDESTEEPFRSGAYAAGISGLIEHRRTRLDEVEDAVVSEAIRINKAAE